MKWDDTVSVPKKTKEIRGTAKVPTRAKIEKPVQKQSLNLFTEQSASDQASQQPEPAKVYTKNQPFALHDEKPSFTQPAKSVKASPFATESNNQPGEGQSVEQKGKKRFQKENVSNNNVMGLNIDSLHSGSVSAKSQKPREAAPFANHETVESKPTAIITGGRAKIQQAASKGTPFASGQNDAEEVKVSKGKAIAERVPGSSGFQLSDGSNAQGAERF